MSTIEERVIKHLSGKLNTTVRAEIGENMPDSYVIIEKTGGGEADLISNATIAIKSYAPTKYEASTLNDSVKDAMSEIDDVFSYGITSCNLNTDYDYTDTTKKIYRYQAVFDLVYYTD